jgi:membrane protein implicated in regulation of membrane protease activity
MNAAPTAPSPLSTGEKVCWILSVAGFLAAILPFVFPDAFSSWGGGQYAMVMVGLLLGITLFISSFLFRSRRLVRQALLDDERLLARWTVDDAEWREFTEEDFLVELRMKRTLFRIVAGIALAMGLVFLSLDFEGGGPWVMAVMLFLILACWVAMTLGTRLQKNARQRHAGEVRVSDDGLMLGGELHVWNGFGARLESCAFVEERMPCIEIVYSTPAKNQRQINSVRAPVPAAHRPAAEAVVARLNALLGARQE